MKSFITSLLIILSFNFSTAQENPQFDWQFGRLGTRLGQQGMVTSDLDGDGVNEIISTGIDGPYGGGSGGAFFTILEYSQQEGGYVIRRMSNILPSKIQSLQVLDIDQDGFEEIYVGLTSGVVFVYDAISCEKINEIYLSGSGPGFNSITGILHADINNNTQLDLAVMTSDTTYVYDSTYSLIDLIPYGGFYFDVGNVDDDSYNEVVYSNGVVVQLVDNNVINEFDFYTYDQFVRLELSDMNSDNVEDIVYASRDTLYVFDLKSNEFIWSQKWESDFNYDQYITGVWLSDYDGDNTKDIFLGNNGWDALYCYNGMTGNKEFSISEFTTGGITNVAVANLDNDSNLEVVWSAGATSTAADHFFIYDLSTLGKEWQSKSVSSDFKAFDVGDVDNDGELEIVSGTFGEYIQFSDYGFLTVVDAETKIIEWQNYQTIVGPGVEDFTSIKIGDIDNDNDNELLLGIENSNSSSSIYVLNTDYEVESSFQIDGMSIIMDMEIFDIDNDGENELIVTAGTNVSGSTNNDEWDNFIHIFDGATGELEWQSEQLAGVASKIAMLHIGNIDEDEAYEIVALKLQQFEEFNTLIVIDGESHELIQDNSVNYTAVSIGDIDNDGIEDIIAGVDVGIIEVLDGTNLLSKQTFDTSLGEINSITTYDMNADSTLELILTDGYTLNLYDVLNDELKWRSEEMNRNIGIFNSVFVGNIDSDDNVEILVNVNHGIFSLEVDYDSIANFNSPEIDMELNSSIIFPNPTTDELKIKVNIDEASLLQIEIFDISGQRIKVEEFNNVMDYNSTLTVDVTSLMTGVYNVFVTKDNKKVSCHKMFKL